MSELRAAVRETWEKALDDERVVEASAVARQVIEGYPELVASERERLIFAAILREIKQIARMETEESSQLSLFGFPSVIAIPVTEDGFTYMRTVKATWEELTQGASIREDNVRRAQVKLDTYNGALEHVRAAMEGTSRTLAEAIALL